MQSIYSECGIKWDPDVYWRHLIYTPPRPYKKFNGPSATVHRPYIPIYREYIWPYMAKNMAKYLAIFGHIWPYIGHRLAINVLMRTAPIFFSSMPAPGTGGGRIGGRGAGIDDFFCCSPVLIPKRPPQAQLLFLTMSAQ